VRQHFLLFAISAALVGIAYAASASPDVRFRLSLSTAYGSLALLVAVLLIGPINILRGRPNPVSTNLRRDIAIWAGTLAVLHTALGLFVHMRGKMYQYFLYPREQWGRLPHPRFDAFGIANYTGLAATLIFALLLALSNDLSLRGFGTRRWKTLQRANYVAMILLIPHAIVYEVVEEQKARFVIASVALGLTALGLQLAGFFKTRERQRGDLGVGIE
jgi:sulfoxide reductase heme-binding subunit YedZ